MHAPLTAPSHASILTGLLPPRHGVRDNGAFVLPEELPTLAESFGRAGYRTAGFVSGFPLERRFGFGRGFEQYDARLPRGSDRRRVDYVERTADRTTAAALAWLAGLPAAPTAADQPWFTWVHYFDPHAPYEPPASFQERAGGAYEGELAFVDSELGRLLAELSARGERGRTLVLVTADHGESLGQHGELTHGVFVYDATLRVPFLLAGPGVSAGLEPAVVARGVDVLPTLLDLAGLPAPAGPTAAACARRRAAGRWPTRQPMPRRCSARGTSAGRRCSPGALPSTSSSTHPSRSSTPWPPTGPSSTTWEPQESALVERLRGELRALLTRPATTAKAPAADPDSSERLRALGYLGGTTAGPPTPPAATPRPASRSSIVSSRPSPSSFRPWGERAAVRRVAARIPACTWRAARGRDAQQAGRARKARSEGRRARARARSTATTSSCAPTRCACWGATTRRCAALRKPPRRQPRSPSPHCWPRASPPPGSRCSRRPRPSRPPCASTPRAPRP